MTALDLYPSGSDSDQDEEGVTTRGSNDSGGEDVFVHSLQLPSLDDYIYSPFFFCLCSVEGANRDDMVNAASRLGRYVALTLCQA